MSAPTYTVTGRVVSIGAEPGGKRRPKPEALIAAGWGYIAVDVALPGVGVATVQCLAPVDFMRKCLGENVTATVTMGEGQE